MAMWGEAKKTSLLDLMPIFTSLVNFAAELRREAWLNGWLLSAGQGCGRADCVRLGQPDHLVRRLVGQPEAGAVGGGVRGPAAPGEAASQLQVMKGFGWLVLGDLGNVASVDVSRQKVFAN